MQYQSIIKYLLIVSVLAAGCRNNLYQDKKQEILFEMEFVSYSPLYQHRGFIIDGVGNVLVYNNPETWNFPDRDLRISENLVEQNLSVCEYTGIKVSHTELQKYSNHIKNLAASKISAVKTVSGDSGITQFICYEYSEGRGTYKGCIIKMEGDLKCENLNFFSKKIVDWMKEINSSLSGINSAPTDAYL
jgi:hypothetical protein